MADNQLSRKQNAEDGFFADDDPLAALARIASFDPQGEIRPKASSHRREPEFNLEDELLKEFEQYEEPASSVPLLGTAADEPRGPDQPLLADEPAFGDEEPAAAPAFESVQSLDAAPEIDAAPDVDAGTDADAAVDVEPVPASEPMRDFPELRAVPTLSYVGPTEPVRPASHPVFELEDEILREFAAFDAKRATSEAPVEFPETQAALSRPVPEIEPEPEAFLEPAPACEPVARAGQPLPVQDSFAEQTERDVVETHAAHSGYGDDDQIAEGEAVADSVAFEPSQLEVPALDAMEAEVDPVLWRETKEPIIEEEELEAGQATDEEIEEPAHFEAQSSPRERWEDEISAETAAELEDELAALDIDAEPESYIPSDDVFAEPEFEAPVAEASKPAASAEAVPVADEQDDDDFGLDELLADVERYPVAAMPARWPNLQPQAVAPPVEKPTEPMPAAAAITASPVIAAPVVLPAFEPEIVPPMPVPEATSVIAPIVTPKDEPVAIAKAEPVAAGTFEPAPVAKDVEPFDEGAFELDLTEIELDMLEMEAESFVAPAIHQDQITASPSVLAEAAKAVPAEKPLYERSNVAAARVPEDYSSLPFDPSQISGEEDPVEAIAEMDVPEAPVAEHDVPVPTQPDYDIDIDAEMAHIFSRPAEPAQRPGAQPTAPAAAAMTSADLDEFERALEEDFRRSLSENRASSTPDRVALTPSSYSESRRESSIGRRLTILAASVAGLVLIGGAGVSAYWGDGAKILSTSSEPKIILADKDPVKIEPENRGGQQVPNQDKAVYDRVSGDDKDITKQERLVTSNEEPVDVVQKTLMPETLPMDDEDQADTTDTSDTSDPRLLPTGHDKNITATEKVVSGVSPRKVRTMVVRSDGTLMPRDEEPAADETKQLTPAEASQERSLDVTPAVTENVPERLTANDDIAKEIQEASADTKSFVPSVQKPSDVVETQPAQTDDDAEAVTDDQASAMSKPVVDADSDAKPADAVPVKKEELPAPVAQTDDNSAADETAAAQNTRPAEQEALKDAAEADVEETAPIREVKTTKITANAPIPANRPVEQPVDIVGRVTDQGNVQKSEEVASADPVKSSATPAGAYVIQIASLPSEAEAQKSYSKLSNKFASVIGGHGVDIKKADIKNKGTYYRVRIVAGTRQEATELCSRYKAAGGSCLVSK